MTGAIVKGMAILVAVLLLPAVALAQGNPANGKELYTKHCAGCHGPAGKGDGPAAKAINPKPTDLTNKASMAGMKDGEIRDVIAYLRSLAK